MGSHNGLDLAPKCITAYQYNKHNLWMVPLPFPPKTNTHTHTNKTKQEQKKQSIFDWLFPPPAPQPLPPKKPNNQQRLTSLPEDVALLVVGVELLGKAVGLQQTVGVHQQLGGAQELVHALVLLLRVVAWVQQVRFIHAALVTRMHSQPLWNSTTLAPVARTAETEGCPCEVNPCCPGDENAQSAVMKFNHACPCG